MNQAGAEQVPFKLDGMGVTGEAEMEPDWEGGWAEKVEAAKQLAGKGAWPIMVRRIFSEFCGHFWGKNESMEDGKMHTKLQRVKGWRWWQKLAVCFGSRKL